MSAFDNLRGAVEALKSDLWRELRMQVIYDSLPPWIWLALGYCGAAVFILASIYKGMNP